MFVKENLSLTVEKGNRYGLLVAVFVALSTGACSSVPDAVNPVEWYKGTKDWVSGEEKPEEADKSAAKPMPGADKTFPQLTSVPKRPQQSTAAERKKMANRLIADRDAARYSDEQFRRQDSSVSAGALPMPSSAAPVSSPAPNVADVASVRVAPRPLATQKPIAPPALAPRPSTATVVPAIPNQPIAVIPNQASASVGLPRAPQVTLTPAIQMTPPLPLVIVGSAPPVPALDPAIPTDNLQRPPAVNPSGGGSSFGQPAPLAQRSGGFFEADQFAPRFPNEVGLPQRSTIESPSFVTAQSLEPSSPPAAVILFADGSARVGGGDRRVIRQIYNDFWFRGGRIHIIGHASSRTRNLDQASHQLANFSISYDRARAVASILERLGVPPEFLVVTAMSDQEPSYFEVMPAGEAGNRRVEVFFEN